MTLVFSTSAKRACLLANSLSILFAKLPPLRPRSKRTFGPPRLILRLPLCHTYHWHLPVVTSQIRAFLARRADPGEDGAWARKAAVLAVAQACGELQRQHPARRSTPSNVASIRSHAVVGGGCRSDVTSACPTTRGRGKRCGSAFLTRSRTPPLCSASRTTRSASAGSRSSCTTSRRCLRGWRGVRNKQGPCSTGRRSLRWLPRPRSCAAATLTA